MKKNITLLVLLILFVTGSLHAQTATDSVKATIDKMFKAFRKSDGNTVKECFADSAIMQTITRNKDGQALIKTETIDDFVKAVSSMPKNAADERIVYDVVKVDGALATVWTPYRFYFNEQFSHCGANSFQLVRLNGVWKIQYIIDTRRKQGCD